MAIDIDYIFNIIGDFGPYQRKIYFLLCLPVIFFGASSLSYVFIAADSPYRCYVPFCDTAPVPVYNTTFVLYAVPKSSTSGYESCHRYQRLKSNSTTCLPHDFSTSVLETCLEGEVFSTAIYTSTIISDFGLTCGKSWLAKLSQSVYFLGMLVGALSFGFMSDRIGRRKTILVCLFGAMLSGVLVAVSPNVTFFNVFRFLNACTSCGVFQTTFVLGLEFVGAKKRVMCGILSSYFFALGEVVLGLLALKIRAWRILQLVISAPLALFFGYYWIIPESVRWQQAKGKHAEVIATLEKIARMNKTKIPMHLITLHTESSFESEDQTSPNTLYKKKISLIDTLRYPVMAARIVFMIFMWNVTTLVYYGLSMKSAAGPASSQSDVSQISEFIFAALVEVPGYTVAWAGMAYVGRRMPLMVSYLVAGVTCIAGGFLPEAQGTLHMVTTLTGKCAITSAFAIIYVYTAEIFPTSIRNTVVGVCSMFARIAGMLAPFSISLGYVFSALPMLVFGSLSLLSGVATIIMPETKGTTLPNTIADALALGRTRTRGISIPSRHVELLGEEHVKLLEE